MLDEVDGAGAAFGIIVGAYHAARLEEHDVDVRIRWLDPPAIDHDMVMGRINQDRKFGHEMSVDRHLTRFDHFLTTAT